MGYGVQELRHWKKAAQTLKPQPKKLWFFNFDISVSLTLKNFLL
jgi:hypothetical protein